MSLVNKIVQFNQRNNRGSLIKTRFIETTNIYDFPRIYRGNTPFYYLFHYYYYFSLFIAKEVDCFSQKISEQFSVRKVKYIREVYLVHLFRPISAARFIKLFSPEKFFKYFFSSQSITVHDLHDACTSRNE